MAGISQLLRELGQPPNKGLFQGYPHSIFIAIGGWLVTIMVVGSVSLLSIPYLAQNDVALFRQVVLLNFSFSLVLSGPVLFIANRYLGDLLLARKVEQSADMFLGGLATITLTQLPIVGLYYGHFVGLTGAFRMAATFNYFVLSSLWLLLVFLAALRVYRLAASVLLISIPCSIFFTVMFTQRASISGMLVGFSSGFLIFLFTLLAYVLAQHRQTSAPLAFLGYFRRYWDLALTGFAFFAMFWADKWAMWFVPGRKYAIGNMPSHRGYENVMMLAMMTAIPALLLVFFFQETRFSKKYLRFYQTLRQHANLQEIVAAHRGLVVSVKQEAGRLVVCQVLVVLLALGAQPALFELLKLGPDLTRLFQFGVVGTFFHLFTGLVVILLLLFDSRKKACLISLSFVLISATSTYLLAQLGPGDYGLGYFVTAMLSCLIALPILHGALKGLLYQTVVGQAPLHSI